MTSSIQLTLGLAPEVQTADNGKVRIWADISGDLFLKFHDGSVVRLWDQQNRGYYPPCRVILSSLPTYQHAGNTLTAVQSGTLPNDIDLIDNDSVLVISDPQVTGIYSILDIGSDTTPWRLIRRSDLALSDQMIVGAFLIVQEGDDKGIYRIEAPNPFTINEDPITVTTVVSGVSGIAGGDLSGSYPNPIVLTSRGLSTSSSVVNVSSSSPPSSGQVLTAVSATSAQWSTPSTYSEGIGIDLTDNEISVVFGTSSTTSTVGNDSRLSDARTPTSHATSHQHGGSDEVGTPIPTANSIPKSGLDNKLAIGWIPTGTTSSTVAIGDDLRLSDARTPIVHAVSHQHGGSDEIASSSSTANSIPKSGADGKLAIGWIPTGSTSTTVPLGNDARFSDSRPPTGSAGGDLSGTYPNPTVTVSSGLRSATTTIAVNNATAPTAGQVLTAINSTSAQWSNPSTGSITGVTAGTGLSGGGSSGTVSLAVQFGTTSTTVTVGNDSRLSDARIPIAHKTSHSTGGSDVLLPADIGAVETSDSRLSDARTPISHAASHQHGGSDEIAISTATANSIPKSGSDSKLAIGWIPTGTTSSTVTIGNDARLNDSRTPTGAASGDLSGSYPSPTVTTSRGLTTASTVVSVSSATAPTTGQVLTAINSTSASWQTPITYSQGTGISISSGTISVQFGTSSTTATVGDDSRLSDARTPTTHAASHQNGGSDEIAVATSAANAIPKSSSSGKLDISWIPTGSTSSTVPLGNDSRLSDSRAPTGNAGGDLGGSYPNPTVPGLSSKLSTTGFNATDFLKIPVVNADGTVTLQWPRVLAQNAAGIANTVQTPTTLYEFWCVYGTPSAPWSGWAGSLAVCTNLTGPVWTQVTPPIGTEVFCIAQSGTYYKPGSTNWAQKFTGTVPATVSGSSSGAVTVAHRPDLATTIAQPIVNTDLLVLGRSATAYKADLKSFNASLGIITANSLTATPPSSPTVLDIHAVIPTATGAFVGWEGSLAICTNATGPVWARIQSPIGTHIYVTSVGEKVTTGSNWTDIGTPTPTANSILRSDGTGKLAIGWIPTGSTSSTVPLGNDSRLSDSRIPTGSAGGDLNGTYPNPTVTVSNGLKSATTTVSVSTATAPTAGQVLTAVSSTSAQWSTPSTGSTYTGGNGINITSTIISTKIGTGLSFDGSGIITPDTSVLMPTNITTLSVLDAKDIAWNDPVVVRHSSSTYQVKARELRMAGTIYQPSSESTLIFEDRFDSGSSDFSTRGYGVYTGNLNTVLNKTRLGDVTDGVGTVMTNAEYRSTLKNCHMYFRHESTGDSTHVGASIIYKTIAGGLSSGQKIRVILVGGRAKLPGTDNFRIGAGIGSSTNAPWLFGGAQLGFTTTGQLMTQSLINASIGVINSNNLTFAATTQIIGLTVSYVDSSTVSLQSFLADGDGRNVYFSPTATSTVLAPANIDNFGFTIQNGSAGLAAGSESLPFHAVFDRFSVFRGNLTGFEGLW